MSKKYLVILAVQFIVMAMCVVFAMYQRTLAEVARTEADRHAEYAQENARKAQADEQGAAEKLAQCERELQECRGAGK